MKKLLTLLLAVLLLAGCAGNKPGTFEAGKNTFLLNGKPFIVKAAEVHYPRIPREYWEHRIEMCKALGMNTLCLYVFWNLHEETPGNYDFTGNKDIAAFCKLAQKHGMYVIVRPGPYVCAEWEMGGLPWWLLKNDSVELRTLDPYYMERVGMFMHEVGKQLEDLQITRGGNIIMVQVENEYGSYATDKPYVSAIRDTVRAAGFTEVPLFQCDWSSNFLNNGLDDLIWTVNFGTGANIDKQFAKLREVRPETPLMCSEFWSGWFDHWGRKHETRPGEVMVEGLKEMLDKGISFSLYMTHGGTTFGWWGGANNPAYSAMCSSYDYDAPISEAGWTTDKYFALRDMLKNYLQEGEKLPDVPQALPVMEVPAIKFTQIAPLINNLPTPKQTEDIKPMEKFDQGWGTILYRTSLPEEVKSDKGISFSLYMTHGGTTFGWWGGANNPAYSAMCSSYDYDAPISEAGWTTDKYFALRDMLKNYLQEGEKLPDVPQALPVMEVPAIKFTQIAPLINNLPTPKQTEDIKPMEKFDQGWGTILYRTSLPEEVKAGTILRITEQHDWTQVFADGKLLARLDRRAGEQEVVLPALKAGTQLDLLVEAMGRVNFDKSIHDRKGITEKVELVNGKDIEALKNWTVYNFPVNYDFVADKNYQDMNSSAFCGIEKNDESVPAYYRATFTLDKVADTFFNMESWGKGMVWVNGHAMGRFWEIGPQQTLYMPGCWLKKGVNEIIVLDLKGPREATVTGLDKPILDMLRVTVPETHRKEGQNLKLTNETPVASGSFNQGNGWQEVKIPAAQGRYFCLEGLSSFDGTNVAAVAEFDVLDEKGQKIPRENWKIVYADSEETRSGNRTADKIYDLQESTFWQTVDNVAYPHQVVIDLGKEYKVTGFRILPRAEQGAPGMIKDYKVYVKTGNFSY